MGLTRVAAVSLLFFIPILACETAQSPQRSSYRFSQYTETIQAGKWLRGLSLSYSVDGEQESVPVQIYFPRNYEKGRTHRTIIALHNYNGSMKDWERTGLVSDYADRYSFVIVCPNMPETVYETKFYPETEKKWGKIPGGKWVGEVLVPYLRQAFGLAIEKRKTAIFGNAYAARGAMLVAATYPDLFGAAAGLSGSYDMPSQDKSRRFALVYGNHDRFRERWESDDNLMQLARNFRDIPVFLAHGEDDNDVHFDQSRLFAIRLLQFRKKTGANPGAQAVKNDGTRLPYTVELGIRKREFHDWSFWRSEVRNIMPFFDKYLQKD